MFRFVLQVAFIRRVLQSRTIRLMLLLVFLGAVVAGAIYTYVIFQAVTQRSHSPHVQAQSSQ
jgi:hypothetical protein